MVCSFWSFYHLQPRKHRYLRYLAPPSLENTAPALLGAACALEVAAAGPARRRLNARNRCYGPALRRLYARSRCNGLLGAACALENPATGHLCARTCIRNRSVCQLTRYSNSLHCVPHHTVHGHARVRTSIYIYIYIYMQNWPWSLFFCKKY